MAQKLPISVQSNLYGEVVAPITTSQTSGIQVRFYNRRPNKSISTTPVQIDSRTKFLVFERDTDQYEIMYFPNAWTYDSGTGISTSGSGVIRGLPFSGSDYTTPGTGLAHSSGTMVDCSNVHYPLSIIDAIASGEISISISIDGRITFTGAGVNNVPVFADSTARDAAITSPSNGDQCYNTAEGKFQDYTAGSWVDRESGGTFSNASTTVAGKVEIATDAQSIAGTETGETGAKLVATPDQIAENVQNSSHTYAADAEASDTYAITLSPAISAYAAGQMFIFKANTANTGAATLNVNGKGAKTIKKNHDQDLEDNDIEAGTMVQVIYDGTNFQIQTPSATNISSASATILTGGVSSNADSLHTHDSFLGSFGAWDAGTPAYTVDTTYTASSDGFVVVDYTDGANAARLNLCTDASTPPTTVRGRIDTVAGAAVKTSESCMTPVKSGDKWRLNLISAASIAGLKIYWIPFS